MQCDRCKREFRDLFDTIVRIDYVESGRGKPYEFHLCVNCRKAIISWLESSLDIEK